MRIECPTCARAYDFPVQLLVDDGLRVQCVGCRAAFVIDRGGVRAARPAAPPISRPAPARRAPTPPPAVEPRPAVEPPSVADDTCYAVIRGQATPIGQPTRRRVVRVARVEHDGPAPPRRIIAHAARLGGPRGASAPASAAAAPASAEVVEPAPGGQRRTRWALRAAAAVALLAAAAGVALWRTPPPRPAVARAPTPSPSPVAPPGEVTTRVITVDTVPERRAVIVYGQVVNDTSAPLEPMRLQVELQIAGRRQRLRTVWCCDALSSEQAGPVANDPRHPHYAHDRDPTTLTRVGPGVIQDFTVVFPSVPAALLEEELEATVERVVVAGG